MLDRVVECWPLSAKASRLPVCQARLKRRAEFIHAGRGGKQVKPGFVLQSNRRFEAGKDVVGIGFTASRKIGGAVERNRAKRRLRALWREVSFEHVSSGQDYVLIARKPCLTMDYRYLLRDLKAGLVRLNHDLHRDNGARPE